MFTSLKRIVKAGFAGFARNSGISAATIVIMVMVILLITILSFIKPVSRSIIAQLQDKIDIAVYFKEDAPAQDIAQFQSEIAEIPEVKEVKYISKEEALLNFRQLHKNDSLIIESLNEIGINPLFASLNIKTQQASQYESIFAFLERESFKNFIEKVDYQERKPIIDRVSAIGASLNKIGILFSVVLGIIAALVAFSAVKIAIHNSKDEIATMRLVGASNRFIKGPFVWQGIIVGIFSALIALLITFAAALAIDSKFKTLILEASAFEFLAGNFFNLLLLQLSTGIGIGVISSMVAIGKYLRV